ncbi:hypothetical protein [Sphingopyxis sp. GW247-27LB]|uniref:hypothetical protein n=1 Tax=Sphingopyxis sp. GW247-27LB TaxID=2012632 RepID=UPI001140F554|nr:hypothetical protein [Sphingopyxis sp. GW247-27LB]
MQNIPRTDASQGLASVAFEPRHFSLDNLALLRFAHDIAQHYRLDVLAVLDRLCAVPQPFLDLARDPVGLTALASMIAGDLGAAVSAPFMVTVH